MQCKVRFNPATREGQSGCRHQPECADRQCAIGNHAFDGIRREKPRREDKQRAVWQVKEPKDGVQNSFRSTETSTQRQCEADDAKSGAIAA
ncbi:MAG: hypothetical protein JSV72_05395, partial [Ralstonia sp.]